MVSRKIKKLVDKLKRKVEHREFYIKVGPDYHEKLGLAVRRENAELLAEVNKLKDENEKLKELIKKIKQTELKKEEEEVKIQEKQIKKIRKENRYIILFKNVAPQIVSVLRHKYFKGSDGTVYRFLRGIEIEDTRNGPVINFLISRTRKDKKLGRLEGPPFEYIPYLFDLKTLVSDLKAGRLIVNIDNNGNFIPPRIEVEESDDANKKKFSRDIEKIKTIDIKHLLKTKDPEVIEAIMSLYSELNKALAEKAEAQKMEKQALMEKIDAEISAESYEQAFDRATSMLGVTLSRLDTAYDQLTKTKVSEISSRLKQTLAEMIARQQWKALDEALDRIGKLGKEEKEVIKESIQKDIQFASDQIINALLTARGLLPRALTPPAIEEKGGKK